MAQDAQPPVLLVPGYGGGTATSRRWRPRCVARARRDDRPPGRRRHGRPQRAGRRAPGTPCRRPSARARSVDIVGYSAGGVTARLWLRPYDGGSVARRIVTLGSPQHGTDLASLASDLAPDSCPAACRQLATDSDLIRSLNSGDETPAGPAWVSIWTTDDQVSTPPETASLDGRARLLGAVGLPGRQVTHGQLPRDPAVIAMVRGPAAAYARRSLPVRDRVRPSAVSR